jgi:hypothetical protein
MVVAAKEKRGTGSHTQRKGTKQGAWSQIQANSFLLFSAQEKPSWTSHYHVIGQGEDFCSSGDGEVDKKGDDSGYITSTR